MLALIYEADIYDIGKRFASQRGPPSSISSTSRVDYTPLIEGLAPAPPLLALDSINSHAKFINH